MKLAEKFIDNDNEYHECRNFNLSLWNGRQKSCSFSVNAFTRNLCFNYTALKKLFYLDGIKQMSSYKIKQVKKTLILKSFQIICQFSIYF